MKRDIRGRAVLITGASGGIGRRLAEQAAQAGARLVIVARTLSPLEELADQLRQNGAEVHAIAADVSDAPTKARACLDLAIDAAALANEGLVVYSPPGALTIAALKRARESGDASDDVLQWKVVSNRRATVDTLTSIGAAGVHYVKTDAPAFDYLGFFPASP